VLSLIHKISSFTAENREKLYKLRDTLEFNTILVSLYSFTYPIFTFIVFNLKHQKKIKVQTKVIIAFYITVFAIKFIIFLLTYII